MSRFAENIPETGRKALIAELNSMPLPKVPMILYSSADNKDSKDYREEDGFIKYTSSIGEPVCLWMIGDKIPFMMSFEKSIDGDRADEIVGCLEFDY